MASRLWGVYIHTFDGYEHVWKLYEEAGLYTTKRDAEIARGKALAARYGVASMMVKKI
jgi:hypothetical protein